MSKKILVNKKDKKRVARQKNKSNLKPKQLPKINANLKNKRLDQSLKNNALVRSDLVEKQFNDSNAAKDNAVCHNEN